jgi:hypothetical protein
VAWGFSPLDEELGLLPGELTPRLQQSVTRLGTWLTFRQAAAELEYLLGVRLSETTVRRTTERAGAAYLEVQDQAVERLEREAPAAPAGPAVLLMSVDGAMVPLLGKQWVEVKTLALGAVSSQLNQQGERVSQTKDLSYFSRCCEAEEFARAALSETQRRGNRSSLTTIVRMPCASSISRTRLNAWPRSGGPSTASVARSLLSGLSNSAGPSKPAKPQSCSPS